MHIITRSIYGSRLQTMLLLGLPYTPVENTTLNEKYDVFPDLQPNATDVPRVRYFCIGKGGHRNATGADGHPYVSPVQHSPGDAALYDALPFLLRLPNNDLTAGEREKYAMRKIITVNGQQYVAYYLKRLDTVGVNAQMLYNSVANNVTTTTPFVPSGANLNPTQPAIPATGVVTTTGDYLSTSAILDLDFTAQDVAELIEVCRIMYDNELYAVISEIGLVAGVDRIVTTPAAGGGTFNYLEAIAAQITTFITAHYSVGYTNNGFEYKLELGATEPLIGLAPGI